MSLIRYAGLAVILASTTGLFAFTGGKIEPPTNEAIGDTLENYFYPYYRFMQVYDSVAISCWFGESFIRRTDNTSNALILADWQYDSHKPLCMTTLDSLTDASNTRPVLGSPGDTITYFKDIIIDLAHGWMTGDFSPTDQIRFITELVDSTSGNVIAYMDTMGVHNFNDRLTADTSAFGSLESTHYFLLPSFESTGFTYEKVFIRVRSIFDGNSNDEVICRWDAYVPEKMSLLTNELATFRIHIIDSLISNGFLEKKNQGAEPVYRYSAFINTTPGSYAVNLSVSSQNTDVISITVYNDLGQKVFHERSILLNVGITNIRMNFSYRPSGIYYVVGTDSREIVLMKRFSYLP
jgi:hypothetical protein